MPVSLMELLAIPLSNLKSIAKWLVISPALMGLLAIRLGCQKTAAKSLVISQWERGIKSRYASFTLIHLTDIAAILKG